MNINSKFISIFMVLLVISVIGCGKSDKKETEGRIGIDSAVTALSQMDKQGASEPVHQIDTSDYKDWETYTMQNLRIMTPPGYSKKEELYDMSQRYLALIRAECKFFDIQVPKDTLVVMLYVGPGQGEQFTGTIQVFVSGDTIYQWPPYHYGLEVSEYLIHKWVSAPTRFPFITNGLKKLFDGSGRNYHKKTIEYVEDNKFIPLKKLAVSKDINAMSEQYQSALAASFVDYIVYQYGINALRLMYLSQTDINSTVNGIFGMTVDSLQAQWLETAKMAAK